MHPTVTDLNGPNSYIGRSLPRPNAKRLLEGKGRYVTDLVLPRMLHSAFKRSSLAHGRILSIDTADAERLKACEPLSGARI